MSILKAIHSPADLKRLSPDRFPVLCQEIREQIIGAVSNVGGHLASNLGVVELTVALQYLLDTPNDKIVWDTSNQSYTHKLLTGRREQFHTLRQYGGLSGFCKREESEYDTFNAGHAGTGVSAAVGVRTVLARRWPATVAGRPPAARISSPGSRTSAVTLPRRATTGISRPRRLPAAGHRAHWPDSGAASRRPSRPAAPAAPSIPCPSHARRCR